MTAHPAGRLAIVVLNHGTAESALRLAAALKGPDFKVLIVDNGSPAPDAGILRNEFRHRAPTTEDGAELRVREHDGLLLLPENLGYTGGNNRGVAMVLRLWDPTHVAILNPDVTIDEAALRRAEAIDRPRVGVVTFTWEDGPTSGRRRLQTSFSQPFRPDPRPLPEKPVPAPRGAAFVIRRDCLDEILARRGTLFEPGLFLYEDEMELGWLLHRLRWQTLALHEVGIRHESGASMRRLENPIREYYSTRNIQLVARQFPLLRRWWVRGLRTVWALAEILLHSIRGDRLRRRAVWQGLRDGYRGVQGKWTLHS